MDEALRRMLAASWADHAERLRPRPYNDLNDDTETALMVAADAAMGTARAIRDGEITPELLAGEF